MPMSSVNRLISLLSTLHALFPPPPGAEHTLAVYREEGVDKLALHVWTKHGIRMLNLDEGDLDRPQKELLDEIGQLIEGKTNESSNEFTLS